MAKGDYSNVQDPVVKEMLEDFDISSEADSTNRRNALDSISFYRGGRAQWSDDLWTFRTTEKRPTESYNQIPKFIRQITNNIRQTETQTRFLANVDATKEIAELYEDLARAIQSTSEGEVAYDNAGFNATVSGWGYWRVLTDYESPTSFDQIIKIKWVPNPLKIYDDPFITLQDFSDRKFLIEVEDVKVGDFNQGKKVEEQYDSMDLQSIGDMAPDWGSEGKKTVRIAEYWKARETKSTLYRNIETGDIFEEEPEDYSKELYDTRDVINCKIMWYKCTAMEVIDSREWPGIYIPYVRVNGETIYENNKVFYYGAVEAMKPPQRLYNYAANSIVEAVASQPKAPYLAAVGQITEPLQKFWDEANTKNYAWLPYNPISVDGKIVGPPQRQQVSADIASMVNVLDMAQRGFNEASGQFQANIGAVSNEKSGIAIQRRNQQSEVSTYHIPDNLARAQRFEGRIFADLIPKTYDGARAVRMLKEDGKEYMQLINQQTADKKTGQPVNFDLTVGTYDIMIDSGPAYTTKRQESADMQMQLFQAAPQAMMPALPIIIRNTDMPGAEKIAEAVERGMPPELRDPEVQEEAMQQVPPQVQMQITQAGKMIQTLTAQLQQAQQAATDKQAEDQAKLIDAQAKVASAQNQAEKDKAEAAYKMMTLQFEQEKFKTETLLETDQMKLDWAKFEFDKMNRNQETALTAAAQIEPPEAAEGEEGDGMDMLEPDKPDVKMQTTTLLMTLLASIKESLDDQAAATNRLNASVSAPKTATRTEKGEWVVSPAIDSPVIGTA